MGARKLLAVANEAEKRTKKKIAAKVGAIPGEAFLARPCRDGRG